MKLLLLTILVTAVFADHHHHDHEHGHGHDHEHHLHDSQIPAPDQMPSHEDVAKLLDEVFVLIDKDHNAQVSGEELRLWLEKSHQNLIDESVKQQWLYYHPQVMEVHTWESYDPEMKETITWDQYIKTTYPEDVLKFIAGEKKHVPSEKEDPNFNGYVLMFKRSEKRWKGADKNGDNALTRDEFRNFIHPEEAEHTKKILVEEALSDMDHDQNGEISLDEYIKHMNDVTPEEEKEDDFNQSQQSQFQTYLDKNKDGVLNHEELAEWLTPDYDKHEAEAVRMIQETDENHDQSLNKDEILKNDEYFLSLIPAEFWRRFDHSGDTTPMPSHDEF